MPGLMFTSLLPDRQVHKGDLDIRELVSDLEGLLDASVTEANLISKAEFYSESFR